MRFILGIDPGFTGAIALINTDDNSLNVVDMPVYKAKNNKTIVNVFELLALLRPALASGTVAFLEQQWPRQGEGLSSAFRSGQGYGAIQTALAAHKIETQEVTPNKWKKHFGLTSTKDTSRALASSRFPASADRFKFKKDHGRAEASLIALYGREKLLGTR